MSRSKIAITIKDDLLKRLDRTIDGKTIRNRSHAIEYFLNKALGAKVQKALIIAGHRDFSCATPFDGKPVIKHALELLKAHEVREILISLHKGEKEVQELLGGEASRGAQISYQAQEGEKIGTARAVLLAKKFVGEDPFFVLYSHVVADLDLAEFAAFHAETEAAATIALTSIEDPSPYGAVQMRGEKIVGFAEKPKEKQGVSRVISAGIFCFSPEIFNYISRERSASLEKDVFPKLVKEGNIAGYLFEGKWCNVRNQICFPGKKKR